MSTVHFDRSIFATYFDSNDAELLNWVDNVLVKLVEQGIIANYIKRGDESDNPNDFEELYRPIVTFFGYIVRLAREFESFKENEYLANQYLENKGHFTCGDENLNKLAYLITNLLRRRARRGTIDTIESSGSASVPDGEILSLVCWEELVFFKLGVAQSKHNSWNVDNSSPLARGCTGRYDLNLGYEYSEDVEDIDLYPLLNPSYIRKTLYKSKQCIEIESLPFGVTAGIGLNDSAKRIVIDSDMDFEITFYVAQDITLENITFGCKCFNAAGDQIDLLDVTDGITPRNYFFETRRLNKAGKFYMIRGIIFSKDEQVRSAEDAKLNIGFGRNLKFQEEAVSIIPYIVMDNNFLDDSDLDSDAFDSTSLSYGQDSDSLDDISDNYDLAESVFIWNLKVTPCSLDYNRCYLDNKNFIDVIIHNQNGKYNIEQIRDILRKYFIPRNTAFGLINLPRDISQVVNDDALLLEDGSYLLLETGDRILLE